MPEEEFRNALENAPAGVFPLEVWQKRHERFGIADDPIAAATVSGRFIGT